MAKTYQTYNQIKLHDTELILLLLATDEGRGMVWEMMKKHFVATRRYLRSHVQGEDKTAVNLHESMDQMWASCSSETAGWDELSLRKLSLDRVLKYLDRGSRGTVVEMSWPELVKAAAL
jgi:hypothetical protein